jgi:hypothetical protein
MTRFFLALIFSTASLTGLGLILYTVLTGPGGPGKPAGANDVVLGFSGSAEQTGGLLDSGTGHEGHKHREKEPFDPDKHKPEPL